MNYGKFKISIAMIARYPDYVRAINSQMLFFDVDANLESQYFEYTCDSELFDDCDDIKEAPEYHINVDETDEGFEVTAEKVQQIVMPSEVMM